jgi:hypothetical protein
MRLLKYHLAILVQHLSKVECTKAIEDQMQIFQISLGFAGSEHGRALSKYHLHNLEKLLPRDDDLGEKVRLLWTCIEDAPNYISIQSDFSE